MDAKDSLVLPAELTEKENRLLEKLRQLESVIVAYSGGVDSSVLAHYAKLALGSRAHIVIALSPSLAKAELEAARGQAKQANFDLIEINTDEVDSEDYRANDSMRCFFCKSTLFEYLVDMQKELNVSAITYGANVDDLSDYRPGHQAAKQFGVLAPLIDAALTKDDIRQLALHQGLPSWDRPQAACLSSRFVENTYITPTRLSLVDKLEQVVRQFDFRQVRVRYLSIDESESAKASVEVGSDELSRFTDEPELADRLIAALCAASESAGASIKQFEIDPSGYSQGKANKETQLVTKEASLVKKEASLAKKEG
ncbi:hypothetical protein BH11CYA1_BH11CYA1_30730 [soil metagenome]